MVRSTLAVLAALCTFAWSSVAAAAAGHLKVLTYDIAGLPDGFMNAHPSANMPQIGPLLARYALALIQEDFAYGELLRQRAIGGGTRASLAEPCSPTRG